MIKENLAQVEKNIRLACERAGRGRKEVTLIAVSKTKPVSMIREAMAEGIVDFGENKAQEICEKTGQIEEPVRFHMIGHLQTNKVKSIIDKVCLIHSVDSFRLAEQISREAEKKGIICPVLLEVNIAKEESKYGFFKEEIPDVLAEISVLKNIRVEGLMTIAPYVENGEENRKYFRELHNLYIDIKSKNIDNVTMRELSMGMTGDYEIAIEEGATIVRVGTGIFGERNYSV